MAARVVQLPDFLRRLRIEGPRPRFTWLTGAGMSASSGIPLASQISRQIILFEYLAHSVFFSDLENPIKGMKSKELTYESKKGLNTYFNWFDEHYLKDDDLFDSLSNDALSWLKEEEKFKNATYEDPETYQELFSHFFQNNTTHHHFLTSIVNRRKGINLAHLGLAGILRDYPEWGHTVFTTNFDDLLLEAIYSLDYTARIFGDLEIISESDSPSLEPTYPQIVHLHGRHTSYRLLNTTDQLMIVDPSMQKAFEKHIAESHLVILGYSGWNDLVMRTLKENPYLLKGTLFWIPYKDKSTIRKEALDFLNEFPPEKAVIIVDDNNLLDADSFILDLSKILGIDNGGFSPYRQGILNYAERQHSFTIDQLREHPPHDPYQFFDLILEAQKDCLYNKESAISKLNKAQKGMESYGEMPNIIKGKTLIEIGQAYFSLGEYEKAVYSLELSIEIWTARVKNPIVDSHRIKTFCLLAEVYFEINDLEKSLEKIKIAIRIARSGEKEYIGYAYILLAKIRILKEEYSFAKLSLDECEEIFSETNDDYGKALVSNISGEIDFSLKRYDSAIKKYNKSKEIFDDIDDELGVANMMFNLSRCYLEKDYFSHAEDYIYQSERIYKSIESKIGLANAYSFMGNILAKQYKKDALKFYEESYKYYSEINNIQGIESTLIDMLELSLKDEIPTLISEKIEEIRSYNSKTKDLYNKDRIDNISEKIIN